MKFVSLFSGAGGMDMGAEAAGWECVAQIEWDNNCRSVLQHHWPAVPKWGDITGVSGTELPDAEAIIFGSPCQDLSVAGRRQGLQGSQSSIFFDAIRIIKEMKDAGKTPRWVVWENVAGALSSHQGQDFAQVLHEMADAGALVLEWAVLDARWFGVPQRRRRVFLVACFDPATAERCPDPLLPVGESLPRDSRPGNETGTSTATSAGSGASVKATDQGIVTALTRGLGSGGPDVAHALAGWLVPALTTRCGNTQDDQQTTQQEIGARRLTPVECERLMGWPDDHTLVTNAKGKLMADSNRYKMCGNGVVAPVMTWVAQQINNV